jgi:hypothetical protein
MFRRLLFLAAILFISSSAFTQEQLERQARLITSFPFRQLTGGVIIMHGQFGNFPDTLNFVLDTGSGGISLDSTTASEFNLQPTPSDLTILGIAGVRKVSFLYNQQLRLPGLTVDSLNFHINDYSILSSVYGERIDGIIGYSLLSRFIFDINYDSLKIKIYTNGRFKYPRGGWLYEPILRNLPVQAARVRDARSADSRFLFDIGAGLCLMLSKDFVEDSNLIDKKRVLYSKQAEGVGGKIDMKLTVIKEIRFGPHKFKNVPTFIFDDTYNITSYPFLGGLIGNDLLRRFNLILNYNKKEFYFLPNSHNRDPFDYTYTGIELYLYDGKIILGDVAEGSPAAIAGLKEGDEVVGINNVISKSLQHFKDALQTAGQKIKMIVRRDGELMEFSFKSKSIL